MFPDQPEQKLAGLLPHGDRPARLRGSSRGRCARPGPLIGVFAHPNEAVVPLVNASSNEAGRRLANICEMRRC